MSTKLKNRPLFLFGVVCAALFGIASSNALALTVANGNFSDLTGLIDQEAVGIMAFQPAGRARSTIPLMRLPLQVTETPPLQPI